MVIGTSDAWHVMLYDNILRKYVDS